MKNIKYIPLAHLWKLTLLGLLASLVGPLLAWSYWPPSSHGGQIGDFVNDLVNLLWPTKILALGSTELTLSSVTILLFSNTLLYYIVFSFAEAFVIILKVRPIYAFQILLAVPVVFQLWFAGFDLQFIEWAPFIDALLFYCTIGILASLVTGVTSSTKNG